MRSITAALAVAFLPTLLIAGCDRSSGPSTASQPPPEVGVVTVQPRRVVVTTALPGRTAPTLIAEVRPQVTGIIQARTFEEGAVVKAGSTLYRIDPATYEAAYQNSRAAVAKSQATVENARRNLARTKELVEIKFVSQQAYDDAAATLRQNEADLAAANAAAEAARINLGYTNVVAPIPGRTGKSTVTVGALVTANQQTALVSIQQLDPMYVDMTQSTTEVLNLKRAMASGELKRVQGEAVRVKLLFEDGSTYAQDGALQFSDVTVDPSTGAITLRALFRNPDGLLLPNMYVRAVIEEGVRERAIVVPQQAVTRDAKGQAVVMVVGADGKVAQRVIQTSRTIGSDWLIDAGLQAGDRVVVEGLQRARPGAVVRAAEIANASAAAQPPSAATAATGSAPAAAATAPADAAKSAKP